MSCGATSEASSRARDGKEHRDVRVGASGLVPRFDVVPGGRMSSLDLVVPQATQLPLLKRLVALCVNMSETAAPPKISVEGGGGAG